MAVATSSLTAGIRPDFLLPTEIYIRQDILNHMGQLTTKHGKRAIVVITSDDFELYHSSTEQISQSLRQSDIGCIIYDELPSAPTAEDIDVAVAFIKKTNCDCIIGFGGPNSLNASKAISLLIPNYIFCNDLFTYKGALQPPVPTILIPAYPSFGLEIAPFFYLIEIHNLTKKVFQHPSLFPRATVVDPTTSLFIQEDRALKTTIATLAIATESVISKQNNDIINTYALKAIDLIFRHLPTAFNDPDNVVPRSYLATASVMSGISFSIAALSTTFAISLAICSKTNIMLEDAMSVIFPHIMDFNLTSSPGKYVQMAKVMGENVKDITVIEAAIKSVEAIRRLESDIDVPLRLSHYAVGRSLFKEIAELTLSYPFIENTPRPLNINEVETILIAAY